MSTYYLLPPRSLVAEKFAEYLKSWLPGLDVTRIAATELGETLTRVTGPDSDVYVIYREDLPSGEESSQALVDGFGAEPGDEIIEVRSGLKPGELTIRRWRLDGPCADNIK